jgi:hypothetical protein
LEFFNIRPKTVDILRGENWQNAIFPSHLTPYFITVWRGYSHA